MDKIEISAALRHKRTGSWPEFRKVPGDFRKHFPFNPSLFDDPNIELEAQP